MNIFPYNDGKQDRFGDPMRIERVLESHCGGSLYDLMQRSKSENPDLANPATDQILEAICKAFELEPFNAATGTGTTEEFQLALLDQFADWRSKKKANIDLPPNSPTTSVGVPFSGPKPYQPMPSREKSATVSGSISR